MEHRIISYRNREIEYNLYGRKEYSVQFGGDDYFFKTEIEAQNFIDEKTDELKEFDKKVMAYNAYMCRR